MTALVNDYDLDLILQTPMYNISTKFSHDYTPRIPFGSWKPFASVDSLDEVKQKIAEFLNSGQYTLVSERGIISTIFTFVDENRKPQEHPAKTGNFKHIKVTPGFPRKSLEQEVVIDADNIVSGGD